MLLLLFIFLSSLLAFSAASDLNQAYVPSLAANSSRQPPNRRLLDQVFDLRSIADNRNYSCDELVRWLGTEKHYSNDKKNVLFGFLATQTNCQAQPYVLLRDISFGTSGNVKTFFHNPSTSKACAAHDELAVVFLSNYSINNNFSHFLHALVRLFCALIDAGIIAWDHSTEAFVVRTPYTLWVDEYFRLTDMKAQWIKSFGGEIRQLRSLPKDGCVSSRRMVYGSGCVRLLPPEKWFGYPGCRAGEVLRGFGTFMRGRFNAPTVSALHFVDDAKDHAGLRVAFAVRDATALTGMRHISNLQAVQQLIQRTQHVKSSMENVTFEHMDVSSTIRYMAQVHVFVSVHGAGMTNMFFMNPGSAVVEIIPYPLCNCRSPDYFYGVGGYYHGSAIAQGIKHYHYCVPPADMRWHKKPEDMKPGSKCSWRHLHAVESVTIDPTRFVSLMRNVERDLIASGTVILTKPVINISPHANG